MAKSCSAADVINSKKKWTKEEEEEVVARYMVDTINEIAMDMGRSVDAVKCKAAALGVTGGKGGFGHWAPWEDDYVRDHYADDPAEKIAEVLGRTVHAIRVRASRLQVKVDGEDDFRFIETTNEANKRRYEFVRVGTYTVQDSTFNFTIDDDPQGMYWSYLRKVRFVPAGNAGTVDDIAGLRDALEALGYVE